MKIFLDDIRTPPDDSWTLIKSAEMTIKLLKLGVVEELSLDHDLGRKKTGHDVLLWMEKAVVKESFTPPSNIVIHSANPVGRKNMQATIESIKRLRTN